MGEDSFENPQLESASPFATVDGTGFIAHIEGDASLHFEGDRADLRSLFGANETGNSY
ncbi:hypothetical protein [Paenibacillus sp. MSJ-34]|uniref:hypothetical protein n=1 Tax=Paenibacillus sp. MSJ-34 TaxID=2841529 RepID=UPI001C0FF573|nr:hypothetical protein [Paenibacillus sp. MSJ-34]MBU5444122.1 hypothetical protein [Paenibacillus sp. MSJ-34]